MSTTNGKLLSEDQRSDISQRVNNSDSASSLEKKDEFTTKEESLELESSTKDLDLEGANHEGTGLTAASFRKKMKSMIFISYCVLIFTAFVEDFASNSTDAFSSYATSSFNAHSLISTAAIVYKITTICAYPLLAKIADLLGRGEGFGIAVLFYCLAYLMYATCRNVNTYIAAEIFYAIGHNGYRVLQQIFIADTTNLKNRGFWSQLPGALSGIPSMYAGSYIQDAFLQHSTWRWGYGSFAIILGASVIPLTICMLIVDKQAKATGRRKAVMILQNLPEGSKWKKFLHVCFVELDLTGMFLLIAGFALFFIPFSITGKSSSYKWKEADVIVMIIIGFFVFCAFLAWNFRFKEKPIPNRKPFVPAQSFKNKTVLIILIMIALDFVDNKSFNLYFSTVLQVGGYYTAGQATRIDNSKKVTNDIASVLTGLAMKYTKRSKIFVLIGVPMVVMGNGLLVWSMNVNGEMNSKTLLYVFEIIIGFGKGLYTTALQVMLQAITGVEGVAMSTAFFCAFNSIGSLIGTAVAGGIWNSVALTKLEQLLPEENQSKAKKIFKSITVAMKYKKGTPARDAISLAYRETNQIIGWTGLGIMSPMLILMLFVREVQLTDKHDDYGNKGYDLGDSYSSDSDEVNTLVVGEPEKIIPVTYNKEKRTWTNWWRV